MTRALADDVGLGDPQATLRVYLANRPSLEPFAYPGDVMPLADGDIAQINSHEGNHWRKIFNVFAKFLYELKFDGTEDFSSWQDYRDSLMLQPGSQVALCYGAPCYGAPGSEAPASQIILMGKQFAEECGFFKTNGAKWLDSRFAINDTGVIVCPYFDYRQLSDERIRYLVSLL
tara:strand:+ start:29130 stop:29651 length:522 start_codon:yes stop_codon:yes gene_type:complete